MVSVSLSPFMVPQWTVHRGRSKPNSTGWNLEVTPSEHHPYCRHCHHLRIRCWIVTQGIATISSDGRRHRWHWELRKNRGPPCLRCWRVETIASLDRNGIFEPDSLYSIVEQYDHYTSNGLEYRIQTLWEEISRNSKMWESIKLLHWISVYRTTKENDVLILSDSILVVFLMLYSTHLLLFCSR